MMNDDKLFRDRLFDMEASYPDDMWDRISANLPGKRRRGGIWFFFLLAAFLLVGFVSGILIPTLSDKDVIQNDVSDINHSTSQEVNYYQEDNNASIIMSNEEDESDVIKDVENNPFATTSAITINHSSTSELHNFSMKSGSSGSRNTNQAIQSLSSSGNHTDVSSYVKVTLNNDLASSTIKKVEAPEVEKRNDIVAPGKIDPIGMGLELDMPEFAQPECPSFGFDRESGIFFDLLYSHDLPQRSLKSKSQELNDYVNSRNNTESTLYSFSASLRIAYISESGLGLKTGFNYSQINEKFEYLDPDASLTRTIITIDTLIVGGVPTVITDTSTIRIPGSLDITTYNRYSFFDIPILATYEAPIGDKFSYSINGGVLFNLAFSQKGRFLDPSDMPVWFSRSEPDRLDAFKNSAGLSLFASIGLHYSLNDHLDIIIEPNFRLYAGSLTSEPYPLEQKWLTLGLSHGIRYKF